MKIIKGIEIPSNKDWDKRRVYPFHKMEYGDSFVFNATNTRDPVYNKIYTAANNFAKRRGNKIKFKFAEIKEGTYGCWLLDNKEIKHNRKARVTKDEISKIGRGQINEALKNHLTIKGAAQSLNISTKTFNKIRSGLIKNKIPRV